MKKKSLLVVPALGVLLLAAAGSVGGTVAWFSSVSSINTEISSFQATRLDGNLSVVFGADANRGTELINDSDASEGVQIISGSKMTHASFDHVVSGGKLSTVSSETASKLREVATLNSVGAEWKAKTGLGGGTYDVYWAVYWTMTFSYNFALEAKADLFLDPSSVLSYTSSAPAYDAANTYAVGTAVKKDGVVYVCKTAITSAHAWDAEEWDATEDTVKGLRIAFLDAGTATTDSSVAPRVWAPYRPTSGAGTPKYIANADISAGSDKHAYDDCTGVYASNVLIGDDFDDKDLEDKYECKLAEGSIVTSHAYDSSHKYMKGYLGTFSSNSGAITTANITLKCVAWFEGTDAAIAPNTLAENMNAITAAMNFYTRENKVA